MRYPGFVGGSAQSQSLIADGETTMNFYVEKVESGGPQSKMALYPTPGFLTRVTVADVGGRSLFSVGDQMFGVMGGAFWEFFDPPSATSRGTVAQDSNLAQIVYNGSVGNQLLIASGGNAYCYDLTSHVLTLELTGEAHQIWMLDGYFLALNQTTGALRISDLDDGTVWDPTQFALRSAQPDPWQAMIVNPPDIWLLGARTGDVWFDNGDSPFPFAPRSGLAIPFGITAPFTFSFTAGTGFWLTQNKDGAGMVVQTQGYGPQKISTPAVDTAIATYQRTSTIDDAESMVFQLEGHTFYVIRFPTANATWAYDLTTSMWTQLGKWVPTDEAFDYWAPRVHCYAFSKHLVADASGTISTMDVTYGSEADGSVIRRMRRGPVLIQEGQRMPLRRFELSVEAGLGLQTGQGVDPQVMFRGSSDGGKTWSSERSGSAGRVGDYRRRVFFTRLGSPRMWVPEITVTDPIPWRIIDAWLNNDANA